MAALTPTFKSRVIELYGRAIQTFVVSVSSDASAAEWIDTDLGKIEAVVGWAYHGTAAPLESTADTDPSAVPVFQLNLQGTGGSAENGSLGVEVFERDVTLSVTVMGTLSA